MSVMTRYVRPFALAGRTSIAALTDTRTKRIYVHIGLIIGALISLLPFYWMIVMSTNTTSDIFTYPPKLAFGSKLLVNIRTVLDSIDFWGALLATVLVSAVTT